MSSIADRIAVAKKFFDFVLASGPDIQADLSDMQSMESILEGMYARHARRYGKSAAPADVIGETQIAEILNNPEIKALKSQIEETASKSKSAGATDNKGPLSDILTQLLQFFIAHPELLTLLISLFKKP